MHPFQCPAIHGSPRRRATPPKLASTVRTRESPLHTLGACPEARPDSDAKAPFVSEERRQDRRTCLRSTASPARPIPSTLRVAGSGTLGVPRALKVTSA